jgi:hypothetical protein
VGDPMICPVCGEEIHGLPGSGQVREIWRLCHLLGCHVRDVPHWHDRVEADQLIAELKVRLREERAS